MSSSGKVETGLNSSVSARDTLKSASVGPGGNTANKKSNNQTQSLEYKVKHMEIGNVNSNTANSNSNKSPDKAKTFLNNNNNSNKNNIDNLLNEASSDESLANNNNNNNNINRLDSYDHPPSKKLLTSPQEDVTYNIDANSQVQPMNVDTDMNTNSNNINNHDHESSLISDNKADNDDSMNASSNQNEYSEDGNLIVLIFFPFFNPFFYFFLLKNFQN